MALLSWSALAPLTIAARAVALAHPAEQVGAFELSVGSSLVAVALCLAGTVWFDRRSDRRVCGAVLLAALALASAGGVGLAIQMRRAAEAQRAFFALVSRSETPSEETATVSAARAFAERYPDSLWMGEALRILAMRAWGDGRFGESEALWHRFERCFADPSAPGVAYAEYSRGLCLERVGDRRAAAEHYFAAVQTIRARHDGIQAWVAATSAKRLAELELRDGMVSTADYWKTRSQTFAYVYSIE